jgi:hypothetical protein
LKFLGYVVTDAEPLCVEFCNSVQCHTFVNYDVIKFATADFNWHYKGVIHKPQFSGCLNKILQVINTFIEI